MPPTARLYLLDTNTVSFILRRAAPHINARLARLPVQQVAVSAVTRGELLFGVRRKPGAHRLQLDTEIFLSGVATLDWTAACADCYGQLCADLERAGTPIGTADTMIAAHALAARATLVTNNTAHFARVRGLDLEDWL